MLDASQTPDDYATRVAADVAARYGLTAINPAVVQRVPTGVSGLPQPIWDGKALAYVQPQGWRVQKPGATSAKRHGLVDPAVHARRERVAEMVAAGASDYQIADSMGVDVQLIRIDRKVMRLAANVVRHTGPSTQTQIRMRRVKELAAEGKTTAEMMEILGVSRDTVRNLAREVGVELQHLGRSDVARSAARTARIAEMIAAGAGRAEIVADLGISVKQVRNLALKAGLDFPDWQPRVARKKGLAPEGKRAARHAALRCMAVGTLRVPEIAAALRADLGFAVSAEIVRRDLRDLGLKARDLRAEVSAKVAVRSPRQLRLDVLRGMDLTDITVAQLVVQFGVSEPQIRRDLVAIGKVASSRTLVDDRIDAVRAKIKDLAAAGRTRKEIMAAVGLAQIALKRHLDALGIDLPRADAARVVEKGAFTTEQSDALRAKIAELRGQGRSISQIADVVHRSAGTISHHLRKLGLKGKAPGAPRRVS